MTKLIIYLRTKQINKEKNKNYKKSKIFGKPKGDITES